MTTQIRDTQFGRLVRLVSRKKVFRYPDEIDPSIQKAVAGQGTESKSEEKYTGPNSRGRPSEEGLERGEDVNLVGWYGENDPENAQNWSSNWKLFVTFQICFMNMAFYMTSSIYTPGEESIMEEFGVGSEVATLGLSLFTLGYGTGPMLWSPMSEVATIGRNDVYFWTFLFFVLLQLPTGFAVNMPMLLVFRFITGFVGSPALATGGATISDMYGPAGVAIGICIWGSFGICGPVFGPILGGFAAEAEGWRWTIWIITWLSGFTVVMIFFFLPETSEAHVLYKRAKRLRQATGDDRLRSQSEIDAAHFKTKDHLQVLGRACTLTFSEPIVFFLDLYTALLYGIFFTWFESFPIVFGDIYGFSIGLQGLVFIGIFVGGVITLPLFILWIRRGLIPKFDRPDFKPEMMLPPTFFGAVFLPICLFWYGWSARASINWIMPVIGSGFFTVSIITLFNPVLNYLGISYPAARQLFNTLGVGPGNSLLAGISICFIPLPYIFYRYGPRLRGMSKNAKHDL
ncbi:hypothetical protein PRZ48_009524 [Zasmidium cellare]|uniref:Major facilitator superfamily (MFS) profile domain-containing protein n=1 Tax=Zasmidium cellare TaxID=395010 RepID=A0ABR0EBY9_ZASCE|nr:hypothetical protein PRZ48_009524 [Zasmidium cellare]